MARMKSHVDALYLSPNVYIVELVIAAETDGSDGSVGDGDVDGMLLISASQPVLKKNDRHEVRKGREEEEEDSIEITEMCFIGLA